ncbi:esterase [Rhizobium sp. Root708]|uniref:alpha/beta hydrolase n=1 Tax=Rhizobium sp. Root708 TaxID=1736592 RepID=UPI0006FDF085|nr:alpha/beta hydrolase [Rhizobium sp. Root708]KRB51323.1 esterase [Rhizobium sp. Root708]
MPTSHVAGKAQLRERVRRVAVLIASAVLSSTIGLAAAHAIDQPPQSDASKQQVSDLQQKLQTGYAGAKSLKQRRYAFDELMEQAPEASRVQVRQVDAGGVDAELIWPARLHHPMGKRVILYVHGGGFFAGSPETHQALAGSLAKAASSDVLLIDYRLAPEYPFPAQIDDTLTAYQWLLDSGYENDNVIIAGDSTGATLAIESVLRQMALKGPLPAAVIAMSPVVNLQPAAQDTSDPLIGSFLADDARAAYLGARSPTDPRISPLYADMTGFPPLLVQVGSNDVLLNDTLQHAEKARQVGVDVTLQQWPGMTHQWQLFPFWLDDARQSNQKAAEYALQHFSDRPKE